jgi:hypothetical protein
MARMANTKATDVREGHGDDSQIPTVKKGTFIDGGGTYMPLTETPYSANRKTGLASGDEK